MAAIGLVGIEHIYGAGSDPAVSNINLTWPDGGACALLGPSGCGKTTLLNIISGLLQPTTGQVFFGDRDVSRLDPRARNIAQVFQFPVVYAGMTVRQNLEFPLRNRGVPKGAASARAGVIAELLELTGLLERRAASLTPDQKQMLSLGRGLVRSDTAAVLFDEPLTVVDPEIRWHVRRKLRELQRELALTMILVTHDQLEALTFADHIAVMDGGRVLQYGSPEDLYARPEHASVGHFIGSPGMNFLPARRATSGDAASFMGMVLAPELQPDCGGLRVGIRPELVQLKEQAGAGRLAARVRRVQDLGHALLVTCTLPGSAGTSGSAGAPDREHIVRVMSPPTLRLARESEVHLEFPEEHVHVFGPEGLRLEAGT